MPVSEEPVDLVDVPAGESSRRTSRQNCGLAQRSSPRRSVFLREHFDRECDLRVTRAVVARLSSNSPFEGIDSELFEEVRIFMQLLSRSSERGSDAGT